jgi:hypothetical protein
MKAEQQPTHTVTTPPHDDAKGDMRTIGRAWQHPGGCFAIELHGEPFGGELFLNPIQRRNWWQRLWRIELPT